MSRQKLIWPAILQVLSVRGPSTAAEIAMLIGSTPQQTYASMSCLGAAGKRWWIRPIARWERKGQFRITAEGRKQIKDD